MWHDKFTYGASQAPSDPVQWKTVSGINESLSSDMILHASKEQRTTLITLFHSAFG